MNKYFKLMLSLLMASSLYGETITLDTAASGDPGDITGSCPAEDISDIINFANHTVIDAKGTFGEGWDADKYMFTPTSKGTIKLKFTDSVEGNFKVSFDDCQGGGNIVRSIKKKTHPQTTIVIDEQNLNKTINIGLWSADNGGDYTLSIDFTPDSTENNNTDTNTTQDNNNSDINTNQPDTNNNADLELWNNVKPYEGDIVAITLDDNNSVIKLTGSKNPQKDRASYTYTPADSQDWKGNENFIAQWDMQAVSPYEIFFVSKSADDPTITNYIGYVKEIPQIEGYSFDQDIGYWSQDGKVLKDWGRYTYKKVLEDTSKQLTSITQNIKQDASDILGIELTSIDYMWVNVYGDVQNILLIDNIKLVPQDTQQAQNHAPVVKDLNITTDEDTNVTVTLSGSDEDNDTLDFSIISGPSHGTFDGSTYTPSNDFNGTDTIKFKASDGKADSNEATVNITVNSVNDAPVSTDQTLSVDQNSSINITLSATDVDGDDLNYTITQEPSHGTFNGTTYTPSNDFNGTDTIKFKANDGKADSNEATITIKVNAISTTNNGDVIEYTEQQDHDNITCPGELLDELNGIDHTRTVKINGTLNKNWDIDIYSFIPKDKNAKLEITLADADGNNIPFFLTSNCSTLLSQENGKYTIPNKCGILSIIVGCDHTYTEDKKYTLTIKYIK